MKKFVVTTVAVGLVLVAGLFAPQVMSGHTQPFYDVDYYHPQFYAIEFARENRIASGYGDHTYRPYNNVSRAEFVSMVVKARGARPDAYSYSHCYYDVQDQWYSNEVCYAQSQGWLSSFPSNWFMPGSAITRDEAARVLQAAFGRTPSDYVGTYVSRGDAAGMIYGVVGNGIYTAAYTYPTRSITEYVPPIRRYYPTNDTRYVPTTTSVPVAYAAPVYTTPTYTAPTYVRETTVKYEPRVRYKRKVRYVPHVSYEPTVRYEPVRYEPVRNSYDYPYYEGYNYGYVNPWNVNTPVGYATPWY